MSDSSKCTLEFVANYTSLGIDPRRFAADAEARGFHGVSCSDHFFRNSAYPHLWSTLAAMACTTERVLLTSSFANNLFRSPVEFVQAVLAIQQLSGGRMEAGLGAGWMAAEVTGAGLVYPPPAERARRYREAVLIARQLLTEGSCRFVGEFYDVDVPVIGPAPSTPVPLVVSVGGSWTTRHVAPLADRVELKFGRTTRGGSLDLAALATVTRDELVAQIDEVRRWAPDAPLGILTMIGIGPDPAVAELARQLGDGLCGGFIGEPAEVLDNLRALGDLGISRIQVSEFVKGSIARLPLG